MKMDTIDTRTPDLETAPNRGRTILFECVYGSKLYGCDMPGSDHDIRGVYLTGLDDFLSEEKEQAGALLPEAELGESDDILYFPVGMFISQVIGMKANCTEIFFAALQARREGRPVHPFMDPVLDAKDELVTADPAGFIGHARQRAARYIEGDDDRDPTLQANRHVARVLEEAAGADLAAPARRICDIDGLVDRLTGHAEIEATVNKAGDAVLMVSARQLALDTRLAEALEVTRQRLQRYERKCLDADPEQMWKDLCTSLRMMETAADLMETGEIVFPRPRAEHYRAIRRGEVARDRILEEIDAAQERARTATDTGSTPLAPKPADGRQAAVRARLVADLRYRALRRIFG